jgi:exonuclease III
MVKERSAVDPRQRFLQDLKALLMKWKKEGKRIIVCLDANEHVYKDGVGRTLTDAEGLDMVETMHSANGTKL